MGLSNSTPSMTKASRSSQASPSTSAAAKLSLRHGAASRSMGAVGGPGQGSRSRLASGSSGTGSKRTGDKLSQSQSLSIEDIGHMPSPESGGTLLDWFAEKDSLEIMDRGESQGTDWASLTG